MKLTDEELQELKQIAEPLGFITVQGTQLMALIEEVMEGRERRCHNCNAVGSALGSGLYCCALKVRTSQTNTCSWWTPKTIGGEDECG